MHARPNGLALSPTDLAAHLGCAHRTRLDREVALGERARPDRYDPFLEALMQRGNEHEAAYVRELEATGKSVVDLRERRDPAATHAAMADGADVIVQAPLGHGRWSGIADLLLRVDAPSRFGAWSYEPADTKLARETKAGTLLQLCVYAELLEALQQVAPEHVHVVTPLEVQRYRRADYDAYYRLVRGRLEHAVDAAAAAEADDGAAPEGLLATYPEPVPLCDTCHWWRDCDGRRRADDHLSLVAGIGSTHRRELGQQGVATVVELAELALPLAWRPTQGSVETIERLHHQARLQVAARALAAPPYELFERVEGRGLARLPEPSPADVFLDFEGDPFVAPDGLEYVTGWAWAENGAWRFRAERAFDAAAEKRAFERFMDDVIARLDRDPLMHVYAFGAYERSALGRLASRHDTRQAELDRLLRGGRIVDLHAVVKEALRAGVERYGLKELEALTGFTRATDLAQAGQARRHVELALELGERERLDPALVDRVVDYNREDCLSTARLRAWLEELRAELVAAGETIARPEPQDGEPSETVGERDARIEAVVARLLEGVPDDPEERDRDEQARWLLAQMAGYFRREEKVAWWEHFRLRELDLEDLVEEREALAGLELVGEAPPLPSLRRSSLPVHRYLFPPQETAIDVGKDVHAVALDGLEGSVGTVVRIDFGACTVDVKRTKATRHAHPSAFFRGQVVKAEGLERALLALGEAVADAGFDNAPASAALDLLRRRSPRRVAGAEAELVRAGEEPLAAGKRLCLELDGGVLPVQGPPGTGKTYSGARMILALVAAGKRVGVTAVSHKVIDNLLQAVAMAAAEANVTVRLVHKGDGPTDGPIEHVSDNPPALAAIAPGAVVGGTAWLWARGDAERALDVLFVDEAGQMALAQTLAAARSARNLVLLGDPQQLEQPRRGAHPDGAEVAALAHVLGGAPTLPADRGLFLGHTYRLHPRLCAFTSEQYYEDRLSSVDGCERQALGGPTSFAGAGLFLVEVAHEGNQASAPEEVEAVEGVVADLLRSGTTWTDAKGVARELCAADVLVVAPYNAQVSKLAAALAVHGVTAVGTVDRFQGQEAPVVVYSCTSSSPADAPRGMGFLYDPHRFNVATSRARAAVIVVASPRLFEPETRTPAQMRMANGLCRYRELARVVRI